jgi:hypothetical protein
MAEVEEAEQRLLVQRRIVAKCMHHVPDNMNTKEGYNQMNIQYEFGTLSDYIGALDDAADNYGFGRDGIPVHFQHFC